ncbi:hypothetical protein PI125_g18217 [Phytophthora idaei]|nr:hypothetical protein PI125_g18217 [Phytophthora idaei]
MQTDDPQWWSGFCETLRGIDYLSPVWALALVSALTQVKSNGGRHGAARSTGDFGRRDTMRRPAIPESMRRLIPINRKGQEPCLLNVAVLPCSGGSREPASGPQLTGPPADAPSRVVWPYVRRARPRRGWSPVKGPYGWHLAIVTVLDAD